MITKELINILRDHFALDWHGIHGVSHWSRVRLNGLRLAKITGANEKVVETFAFIHDSCRINDGGDPDHGARAAVFARDLVREEKLLLLPEELELLVHACQGHSGGSTTGDVTVCTCWDADRLDLGRVGIIPNPDYLCTDAAKDPEFLGWAYQRSIRRSDF